MNVYFFTSIQTDRSVAGDEDLLEPVIHIGKSIQTIFSV